MTTNWEKASFGRELTLLTAISRIGQGERRLQTLFDGPTQTKVHALILEPIK